MFLFRPTATPRGVQDRRRTRGILLQSAGVVFAAAALLGWILTAARADPPATPVPSTSPDATPAAGVQPRHIPPTLVGAVQSVAPDLAGFQLAVGPRAAVANGAVNIALRSYTHVYQLSRMQQDGLQHGDSVLVQGRAAADPNSFRAVRVLRLARKLPLAPGVDLVAAPVPTSPSGAPDAFATLGQQIQSGGSAAPLTSTSPLIQGKALQRARRTLERARQRGQVPGLVVSSNPLVLEMATGETLTVQTGPETVCLDQQAARASDLRQGALVQVRGSETGPGVYRASEINVLPAGMALPQPPANRQRPGRRPGLRRRPLAPGAPLLGRVAYPGVNPGYQLAYARYVAAQQRYLRSLLTHLPHPRARASRVVSRRPRIAYRVKR